jgi:hypothetical protein
MISSTIVLSGGTPAISFAAVTAAVALARGNKKEGAGDNLTTLDRVSEKEAIMKGMEGRENPITWSRIYI